MAKNNRITATLAAGTFSVAALCGATAVQAQTTASTLDANSIKQCSMFLAETHQKSSNIGSVNCSIYERKDGVQITFEPRDAKKLDRYNVLIVRPGETTVIAVTELKSGREQIYYTTTTGNEYTVRDLNDQAVSHEAIPADVLTTLKNGIALEKELPNLKLGESADPSSKYAYNMVLKLTDKEVKACMDSMVPDQGFKGEYIGATDQIDCWTRTFANGPEITFRRANSWNNMAHLTVTANSVKLTVSEEENSTKILTLNGNDTEVETFKGPKMAVSALAPPVQEALAAGQQIRRTYNAKITGKPAGFVP